MNKTLALIAALGLVVSVPAFAADMAADGAKTEATTVKKDEKTTTKTVKADEKGGKKHMMHAKKTDGSKESKEAPAAGKTDMKSDMKTETKTETK